MTTTDIRPGDTVRTKGHWYYKDGTEFTVERVVTPDWAADPRRGRTSFALGDPSRFGVWMEYLEKVDAAAPTDAPTTEDLRRENTRLTATLAQRNQQIDTLSATIAAQREQLIEYAADYLALDAGKLGLGSTEAAKALEYGARLLAHGWNDEDVDKAVRAHLTKPAPDELDAMLREFHDAFEVGQDYFISPYTIDTDFLTRQHMLQEETNELLLAIREGDPVAVADALGDIIYIAAGTADLAGIPITRVLRAIHAANMRKLGPDGKPVPHPTVPGKIGKPEGWTGPEDKIREILKEAGL